jgi:hypothetical protein
MQVATPEQADKTSGHGGETPLLALPLKPIPSDVRLPIGGVQPRTMEYVTHKSVKGNSMNFDPGQLTQVLDHVPYPIGKTQLVQFAQQHGANEQLMGILNQLPDKTFNSSQEVKDALGGLGGLGNLGNLGGLKL